MRIKINFLTSLILFAVLGLAASNAFAGLNPLTIMEPIETGIAGSSSTFIAENATPTIPVPTAGGVEFYYGLAPGVTDNKSAYCPGTSLDLNKAKLINRAGTNAEGISTIFVNVPASAADLTVYLQVIDTENCEKSEVVPLTFEPPIIDEPMFLNPLVPGTVGKVNSAITNGATPGGLVKYIWGFIPGVADGSALCPGFMADIADIHNLSNAAVDPFGNTVGGGFFVPLAASGLTVYIQAVDMDTCIKSNVVETTFD